MRKIILALLMAACTSEPAEQTTGQHVLEMCGPPPVFPPYAYAVAGFDSDCLTIVITTETHGALIGYRLDALAWQDCVGGLP